MSQPRADAKLKNLPAAIQGDLWLKLTEPQDDCVSAEFPHGRPWTLDEGRDWLLRTHQVQTSMGALSNWRQWRAMREELARTNEEVEDLQAYLKEHATGMTAADIMEAGNLVFIHRASRDGDAKTFKAISDLILRREAGNRDLEKLRASDKSKIDAGLDALFQEIQGNPTAESLFKELKAAVEAAAKPEKR